MELYLPAFYLGVAEELEKSASEASQLNTSVRGETPEQLLHRVRTDKYNFPKFMQNAQNHNWNVPGVPFANSMIHGFLKSNANQPETIKEKIQRQDDPTLLKIINKNSKAFEGVQNNQHQAVPQIPTPVQPANYAKVAVDINSMPLNENILPNINKQTKWKYVRSKDGLKLTDGNLVYSFGGFPEDYPTEDARVSRATDDNILNLENDALSKGTAQIHRSSPDNIYMTLADGRHNPTFMLQHESGQNWRYTPSKKFIQKLKALSTQGDHNSIEVNPESLLEGAQDTVKQAFFSLNLDAGDAANALTTAGHAIGEGLQAAGSHPVATMLAGYTLAKGLNNFRSSRNPAIEEERKRNPFKRNLHELAPMAAGYLPALALGAMAQK